MHKDATAFIYEKDVLHAAIYNETRYTVFTPVKDTFDCSVLRSIISGYSIEVILVPPNLESTKYKFISQCNLEMALMPGGTYKGMALKGLSEQGSRVFMALAHYVGHTLFTPLGSHPRIGYMETLPVFMEDITNYLAVNQDILKVLNGRTGILESVNSAVTKPGRETVRNWLSFPLASRDEIYKRHAIQKALCPLLTPIQAMLKQCRCFQVRSRKDFPRLKQTIQAAKDIHRLTGKFITFKNEHEYSKLFEMLGSVGLDGIEIGVDSRLDELRQIKLSLPMRLNKIAQEIADSRSCILSVAYFPQIGFFIEGGTEMGERQFTLCSVNYYKTKEMVELDNEIGDIESLIHERENKLINEIHKEVERTSLCFLYDYVGEVDAYSALISFAQSHNCTAPCFVESGVEFGRITLDDDRINNGLKLLGDTEFNGKCIILELQDVLTTFGLVVLLAQAGIQLPFATTKLPLFDKILCKFEQKETVGTSTFLAEIKAIGSVVESCTENSLCLIENLGRGTAQCEGLALFLGVIDQLNPKLLLSRSHFTFLDLSNAGIVVAKDLRKEFNDQILKLFSFYCYSNKTKRLRRLSELEAESAREILDFDAPEEFKELVSLAYEKIEEAKPTTEERNSWAVNVMKSFLEE